MTPTDQQRIEQIRERWNATSNLTDIPFLISQIEQLDAQLDEAKKREAALVACVQAHHRWHGSYDDYGGYSDSELCNMTESVLVGQPALDFIHRSKADKLAKALERARQLASVAQDWDLVKVEIDGELETCLNLEKEFKQALDELNGKAME